MSAIDVAMPLVKSFEGCKLIAYPDPATGGDPWTIGFGATGSNIKQGIRWTLDEAYADLSNRLLVLESQLKRVITFAPTDNEMGAMLSLAYNIGIGAFSSSSLVRKFNAGDVQGAADEFPKWNKAAGQVMPGLVKRREAEQRVFLTP